MIHGAPVGPPSRPYHAPRHPQYHPRVMRGRGVVLSVTLAIALSMHGCSSDTDELGEPVALDALVGALAASNCEGLFRCRIASRTLTVAKAVLGDEATCRASVTEETFGELFLQLLDDVRAGRVSYDPAAAGRCLAVQRSSCSSFLLDAPFATSCPQAFIGSVAAGGECHFSHQCAPGLWCSGDGCPGTCVPAATHGQPCDGVMWSCVASTDPRVVSTCTSRDGQRLCQDRVLGEDEGDQGEACGFADVAEPEVTASICAPDLVCTDRFGGTCQTVIPEGGDCSGLDTDDRCASGTFCVASVCRALVIGTTAGAPCDEPQVLCDRRRGLVCERTTGTCVSSGDGSAGSPCAQSGVRGRGGCQVGLYCGVEGHCEPLRAVGASCTSPGQCASRACECDDDQCTTRRCAPEACGVVTTR